MSALTRDDILAVPCTYCNVKPGAICQTPRGKTAREFHASRTVDASVQRFLRINKDEAEDDLPAKGKYQVRAKSHAWCDHHCTIHPAIRDYYDEDGYRLDGAPTQCNPDNWRRVYVASDDKDETF